MTAGIAQAAPQEQAVRVRLLGEFAMSAGDQIAGPWPRPSARRLCELLLVTPGRRVSRDVACDELFPRLDPRTAARSLSKALSMARTALGALGAQGGALLHADLTHIWLSPALTTDADEHAAALRAGAGLPPGMDRDDLLSPALADDAELLPDEPYADWAERAREQLAALRQEACLTLARDRANGAGRSAPADVTAAWLACLDHDPACEEAAGALVRGYLAAGRPELAARVFERCRSALEGLGLRISPSLERVYAAAVARRPPQPALAVPGTPQVPASSLVRPVTTTAPGIGVAGVAGVVRVTPVAAVAGNGTAAARDADAPRPLPRSERRPVSVLFAEVAAPAGLAGMLGLEALRDLVGGALALVIAEVETLGGTVSSVSGRGLQAMFGAPEAHEDDPERAVRAAYRALTAVTAMTATTAATAATPLSATTAVTAAGNGPAAASGLALRIGVESGPALVGPVGGGAKVEYAALGDVVSDAAALQSAARPGSVLVGPATQIVTGHLFTWGEQADVAPDPTARALTATYLGAPRAQAADRWPRIGGRAPLIGRQDELRVLDTALRAAVAGKGRVVLLTGEPGIGKTRLMQESRKRFIAWLGAGGGKRPLWLESRAVSYASVTPYSLYRQLVAGWINIALDQPPALVSRALADALTRLMGNTNLLAPLAHLMGLPHEELSGTVGKARISAEEQQRLAFGAVRALVSRFAAVAPTVLVLEDLHWADPTSLRLTLELAELTADRSLLLIAASRPGPGLAESGLQALAAPRAAAAAAGAVTPPTTLLRLRPLGLDAAQLLARSLIGQVSGPEVLSDVLAGADGNPLFLEERLAAMLQAGVLVRDTADGQTWRLREAVPAAAVPLPHAPTPLVQSPLVQAPQVPLPQVLERLVRSRVDQLSPAAADAIRAASVLGAQFTRDLLGRLLGTAPAALGLVLDEMCASDLVHRESPERSASRAFLFRHALIQEAVYLALLRPERRDLHTRAAQAIEASATAADPPATDGGAADAERRLTAVAAVLGRHYAAAEDERQAVRYLELAGDHNTAAFANDEAVASFSEALAVSTDQAATVRLYGKLANVQWRVARREQARDSFIQALRLADEARLDPLLRAHLRIRLGRLEQTGRRFAEATAAFDAAEALLLADPSSPATSDAAVDQWLEMMVDGRADLHVVRLEHGQARAALDAARPVLEARGTPARKTTFYRVLTMQRLLEARLRVGEEDIARLRVSIAAAEEGGEDKDVGYATAFLGWALWLRGDLAEAAEELEKALAMADRIGETVLHSVALRNLIMVAMRRHDEQRVRTLFPLAFPPEQKVDWWVPEATALACSAWLAWRDGDGDGDGVRRLAAQIDGLDIGTLGSGSMCRWIYLFPVIAAELSAGNIEAAAKAAGQIIDPRQQLLDDDVMAALAAACAAWERKDPADPADPAAARRLLDAALELAHVHAYF